jgi:hypothetical protein
MWGGLAIGAIAGVVCYAAVLLKPGLGYDDSLDVFGVHGVGGFLGAVLTGVFCYSEVNSAGGSGLIQGGAQLMPQVKAAALSAGLAFAGGLVLTFVIDLVFGFATTAEAETTGLDQTEHGEAGFDFGFAEGGMYVAGSEPRPAKVPPGGQRFHIVLDGVKDTNELARTWSDMCQPGTRPPEFKAVFPNVTTVQGNRFTFRGGDQDVMRDNLQRLLQDRLKTPVKARVESA